MIREDIEVPRYRKPRNKTVKKSDHKHDYYNVIVKVIHKDINYHCYGRKCRICGKIITESFIMEVTEDERFYKMLSPEEILEKYKDLEIVEYHI